MTNKFSCFLTQKGRWLTATLFLLFSLGIGNAWGDQTWDFTQMSDADKTAYDAATTAWTWNSNGYYNSQFTASNGVWTDVISTTITQIKNFKFKRSGSSLGAGTVRVYKNASGKSDGYLGYNNGNVHIGFTAAIGDTIIVSYFNNENSSTKGYVLTGLKRIKDNATTIQVAAQTATVDSLIATATAVDIKAESSKIRLYKLELKNPVSCTKPTAPVSLAVDSKTHNTATLSWDPSGAGANGYKIALVSASGAGTFDWKDGASNTYTATDLTPETEYTFKVKYKGSGEGVCDFSDEVTKSFTTDPNPAATTYKVTLVPAGGTISDASGWTLNAGNYEKEVSEGTVLTLPTFTKENRTFKTWRKAGPADVTSPITVTADVTLTAVWNATIDNVLYYWAGAQGGATEVGGTATGSTDGLINVAKSGYYCLQINGNTSYDKYVEITLSGTEKVKTGDKIRYTGFYTNTGTKNAAIKMRTSGGTAIFTGANLPRIETNSPRTDTYTVETDGINSAAVQITRHQTQTSSWIPMIQILRPTLVEEANVRTVTFNFNDGATANTTINVASGSTVYAEVAPTYAHHRFNGWKLNSAAYDFSTPVTSNITLTADWTQLYTISFSAGDGSGDAPAAVADKAQGETFKVPANTFTAPGGKEFDKWNDGTNDYAPDATYTVGTANVVLTAQWKAASAKYTVVFKDGTTELGTKQFNVTTNPSDADIDKTKPLYTFAAWQKDEADIALDDAFWASVAANAEVTLTARWAKAYAADVDFEAFIDAQGTSGNWQNYLATNNYAISNTADVSLDDQGTEKPADKGLKMKNHSGAYVSFNVHADKLVLVKMGRVNGMSASVDGGTNYSALDGAASSAGTSVVNYLYNAVEAEYRLKTTADAYNIIQSITITNPYQVSFDANGGDDVTSLNGTPSVMLPLPTKGTESFLGWFDGETKVGEAGESYTPTANITLVAHWEAVSTDARLASITFSSDAGTLEPAFDPEVVNYTYTMPYKTAAIPTITGATSVNANAQEPEIVSQASAWNETAVIRGVAQSGDKKTYNITMKVAPKDPTCLIWADIPSANTLTFNASKSLWNEEDVTLAINGVSGKDGSAPSGVKFQKPGYIKIQKNEGSFQIGDIVALDVTYLSGSTMHVFKVQEPSTATDVIGTGTTATTPAGVNKVTITEDAATLWLARPDNSSAYKDWNPHVDYVAVYRAMNPVLKSITFAGVEATVNEAGKTVTVTVPNATNLGTMAVVPTIFRNAPHATTPEAVTTNGGSWVEGSDNTYRIMDKDGDYTDYTVTITRAAVSHDATLSALTVDGNAIALEDDVYTYAYEYETGTAVSPAPVVVATAHDANAKSVEITQASDKKGTATVVVTAEDNTTTKTYTINFSISTKIKVVIFDGNDDKATAIKTSPHATGASWVVTGLSADDDDKGTSYATKIATGGQTGSSKNIAVTIPVNYQPFFELAQASNKNGNERKAFITTTANGSGTKLYELANSVTNTPSKGMSTGLTEETTYYIHSDNSINFYEVNLYLLPLAPKAATPTLSGLADLAACTLGTDELTVTASDLDGGTAHYQWYKVVEGDDPDEAVGTDANTYAPAVAGNYYVVVTNQKDGCRDNSKKSNEVTVSVKTHTEITVAPLNQRATVGNNATLSVTAIGDGILHYTWYTCDDELGTNPVAVDPANDAATYEVTVTAAMNQWYKVTVHGDCGEDQSATAKVSEFVPATPANVTESIVWDWNSSAWPASGQVAFTDQVEDGTDLTPAYELLADADAIVPNNAAFRSDMLYGKGQWVWRSGNKFFQGTAIKFNTTVAGKVRVNYRSTGSNKEVQVTIAGTPAGKNKTSNFQWSEYVEVPAGDVEIICLSTDEDKSLTRVQKIEFYALAHQRTTGYNAGDLGTVCLEDATFIEGANLYELAGLNENGYLAFDQITTGNLEEGKPYLFEVTNPSKISFYKPVGAAHTDTEEAHKGMIGTFSGTTLSQGADNLYYFSGRHIWKVNDFTVAIPIPDHRCYVDYDAVQAAGPAQAPAAGRRRVTLGVQGKGTATDINNVEGDNVQPVKMMINGQLFILRGEKLYDATGRLVK